MRKFSKPADTVIDVEGVAVVVRSLTAGELSRVLHSVETERTNGTPWRADYQLVSLTCHATDGTPLFVSVTDVEAESPTVVARLVQACVSQNKLADTHDEKKGVSEVAPLTS